MVKKTSPSNAPWVVLLLLTLIGIALSVDLTYIHVKANLDPTHQSFCSPNARFNCDNVARSTYSRFLDAPVSVWGLFGYLLILLTALLGRLRAARSPALLGILFFFTGVSTLTSAWMGYLSFKHVDALCILCLTTYVINPILLAMTWVMIKQQEHSLGTALAAGIEWSTSKLQYTLLVGFMAVLIPLAYPKYWEKNAGPQVKQPSTVNLAQLPNGADEKGHPWIGSTLPAFTITTFSDYECPFCQRANFQLRQLIADATDTVRVIHRHYPLDQACNPTIQQPFHAKACTMAYAAYCAAQQGKFWSFNDMLYLQGKRLSKDGLADKAKEMGLDVSTFSQCVTSEAAKEYVAQDLKDGTKRMVQGTPSFFLKGQDDDLPQGTTPEGSAWIGAEKPVVTIEEFADYECPFCRLAHEKLRELVRQNKGKVRLIHRHFPLDQSCNSMVKRPFHQKACLLAQAAECAGKQKQFWPMNDLLYQTHKKLDKQRIIDWSFYMGLDRKAFQACLDQNATNAHIQNDIEAGQRYKLRGTPAFRMNGKLYTSMIPPKELQAALQGGSIKALPRSPVLRRTPVPSTRPAATSKPASSVAPRKP